MYCNESTQDRVQWQTLMLMVITKVSIRAGNMFFTKRLTMNYSRKTLYCGERDIRGFKEPTLQNQQNSCPKRSNTLD